MIIYILLLLELLWEMGLQSINHFLVVSMNPKLQGSGTEQAGEVKVQPQGTG